MYPGHAAIRTICVLGISRDINDLQRKHEYLVLYYLHLGSMYEHR